MTNSNIILLIAVICVGLMSGLFFAYSCSVMPGLGRLNDHQFLSAMHSINRAIQNPVFFIVFFGVLVMLPLATYLKYARPAQAAFWFLLASSLIYFTGTFLVTATGNIPLNNALDKFDLAAATKESLGKQRKLFESKWNSLNLVRTISSFLSFICALLALLSSCEKPVRF